MKSFGHTVAQDTARTLTSHELDLVSGGDEGITATGTVKIIFREIDDGSDRTKKDVDG